MLECGCGWSHWNDWSSFVVALRMSCQYAACENWNSFELGLLFELGWWRVRGWWCVRGLSFELGLSNAFAACNCDGTDSQSWTVDELELM